MDKYCAQFEKEQNEKLVSLNDKIEKTELESYHLKDTLIKNIKALLNSNSNKTIEIKELWKAFWDNINKLFGTNNDIPQIPFIDERMFEKIDDILEILSSDLLEKVGKILTEEETKQKKNKKNDNELMELLRKIIFDEVLLRKVIRYWQITQLRKQFLEDLKKIIEYELDKLSKNLNNDIKTIKTECDRDTKRQEFIKESNISDLDKAKEELDVLHVT